ncbi:VOC family protein [Candidatus Nanopelagicales bacterium]|nr:VOC family protein [Candidatus Nanopelagicales bacterium]
MSGIPGLQRVDHIGVTVPDLVQAHDFFIDVLGCEYMYKLGPFEHVNTDWMEEHLNVHPRAVMKELHFYRLGGRAIFEIFEYSAPDQNLNQPKNSDIGGHHIALYVDDFDSALEFVRDKGLQILGEPTLSKNASEGQRWVYFLSPWGMQCELVSYPNGKAFDHTPEKFE